MDRKTKFINIGKCLDRYEEILRRSSNFNELNAINKNRIDRFIDLDVSKVNVVDLANADDETFVHDMSGIFAHLKRNSNEPEKSEIGDCFVPRVGWLA